MKTKVIIYIFIIVMVTSCSKPKLTLLEQGIYDIDDMKTYLPEDVDIVTIDDSYIVIDNLKRTDKKGGSDVNISIDGNTIAMAYPDFYTFVDEDTLYDGKIEMYDFNKENNSFILGQTILPPYTKEFTDDKGYIDFGNDMRTLSENIKLYKDQLLVNAGYYTSHKNISGFKGLGRKQALEKIKTMPEFSDQVFLYKRKDSKWKLNQIFNADFGDDYTYVEIKDEIVRIPDPFFGVSLDITDDYSLIYQDQILNSLYLYRKKNDGNFKEIKKYPIDRSSKVNTSMTDTHFIYTEGHSFKNTVKIINNKTAEVETTLRSPINSTNQEIGEAVAITSDLAFISEAVKDKTANFKDAEDRSKHFPGYVHTFKRENDGSWGLKQTIKSPFNVHYELFGYKMIANENNLIVTSSPAYQRDGIRKSQPGLIYIFKKQDDLSFRLQKILIGYPDSTEEDTFYIDNLAFFQNGLLFSVNWDTIRYVPDLF